MIGVVGCDCVTVEIVDFNVVFVIVIEVVCFVDATGVVIFVVTGWVIFFVVVVGIVFVCVGRIDVVVVKVCIFIVVVG